MAKLKDYYAILGVKKDATEQEIKAAYRQLAKEYHPDVNKDYEELFKEINEAYSVLSDKEKRAEYDSLLGLHQRVALGLAGCCRHTKFYLFYLLRM